MGWKGSKFAVWSREKMMQKRKHSADEDGRPLVVLPSESDVGQALSTQRLCGFCKQWDHDLGQKECVRQKFWQRMLREEKYRAEWFEDPRSYGLCRVFEGRLVPFAAPATCVKSDLDEASYGKKGANDKIACPFFVDKRKSGSSMVIGPHARTQLEH